MWATFISFPSCSFHMPFHPTPFQTYVFLVLIIIVTYIHTHILGNKYISAAHWVHLVLLVCAYFRDDHLVLDEQLGGSSLGNLTLPSSHGTIFELDLWYPFIIVTFAWHSISQNNWIYNIENTVIGANTLCCLFKILHFTGQKKGAIQRAHEYGRNFRRHIF